MSHRSTQLWDSENHNTEKWGWGEKLGIKGVDLAEQMANALFFLLICKQDRHDFWARGQRHPRHLGEGV